MALQNPPGWLQNAGDTHTAAQLRMYIAALQAGMSGGATSLIARGGVHPGLGQELVVTQAGSPNMTVLVEPGMVSVPGSQASTQGNYLVVNATQETLSIAAAHATLSRIDLVVINIRDSFYSGVDDDAQLQVVTGTPASSPVAPSAPDNSVTIAQIAVGPAVTTIVNANITDTRRYIAAVGGVMNITNIAAIPASTEMREGQLLWAMDTNILYVWDGSTAQRVYPDVSPNSFVRKTVNETVNNSATFQNDDVLVLPVEINSVYTIELDLQYNSGTTPDIKFQFTAPAGATLIWTMYAQAGTFLGFPQSLGTSAGNDGLGFPVGSHIKGVLVTAGTAGNLQLQWAQTTANASNTVVQAGSWMAMVKR